MIPEIVLAIFGFILSVLIIPGIHIMLFLLAVHLEMMPGNTVEDKISKIIAIWLGICGFLLVMTLHVFSGSFAPSAPIKVLEAPWAHVAAGVSIGLVLIASVHSLIRTRVVPVLVSILSFTSLSSLYFYIFVSQRREPIVLYSPCVLVGVLLYLMFVPSALADIISGGRR